MKLRTPAAILVTGASWGLGCQEYNPALLPGALTVTPEALDFGSMPTGERPVLTLQLANPGEAPVGVLGVSAEDPFWVDPYEAELEGGRVVSLEVGFVAVEIGGRGGGALQRSRQCQRLGTGHRPGDAAHHPGLTH